MVRTVVPLTATMMSDARIPASSAGLPPRTPRTTAPPGTPSRPALAETRSSPSMPSHTCTARPFVTSWSATMRAVSMGGAKPRPYEPARARGVEVFALDAEPHVYGAAVRDELVGNDARDVDGRREAKTFGADLTDADGARDANDGAIGVNEGTAR